MMQKDSPAQVLGSDDPPKQLEFRSTGCKKYFVAKQQLPAARLSGRRTRNTQKLGPPLCVKDKLQVRWKVEVDACFQLKGLSIVTR
jgi:hypothetical protein